MRGLCWSLDETLGESWILFCALWMEYREACSFLMNLTTRIRGQAVPEGFSSHYLLCNSDPGPAGTKVLQSVAVILVLTRLFP